MTYIKLQPSDVVIDSEIITKPAWSNDTSIMNTFYAPNVSDSAFYVDVYRESLLANPLAEVQFSIAYGHKSGSGNIVGNSYQTTDGKKNTEIFYSSIRQKVLNSEKEYFTFSNSNNTPIDSILVISLDRSVFKEKIKTGFNLKLTNGSNSLHLTDDSNVDLVNNYVGSHRYYNIISGSNGNLASGQSIVNTTFGTYGMVLPDLGVLILNPMTLSLPFSSKGIGLSINSLPSNVSQRNELSLFNLIQSGASFELYSQETVTSKYYFCRVPNVEMNFTTNPSLIDDNGNIFDQSLIDFPTTYYTGIGLYNSKHELVAYGKLSKPRKKNFLKEDLIKTKISY